MKNAPETKREDILAEITKCEGLIKSNPQGSLVPAARNRIAWLEKKLRDGDGHS
jgi:hypothetical protein